MKCSEIMDLLEEAFPIERGCEWDRCHLGLIAGRKEKEVHRIYVAMDATKEVIENAIEVGADMLVTHHPMLFRPVYKASDEDFTGERLVMLLQHDICYYAAHTNYDVVRMGVLAAEKLGLKNVEPLCEDGIGCIGDLVMPDTLQETAAFVKTQFALPFLTVYGDRDKEIRRIAVTPGSGSSTISDAITRGADMLLCGDISHHDGIDAVMQGLALVDGGHYGTEYMFIEDMAAFLRGAAVITDEEGTIIEQTEVLEAPVVWPCWRI